MTDLTFDDVTVRLPTSRGESVHACNNVTLRAAAGNVTALIGESGSGKSTLAAAALGLLPHGATATGTIRPAPTPATRGSVVAWLPQSPATHLTPTMTAYEHLRETLAAHEITDSVTEAADRAAFPRAALDHWPHELSGGMAQRLMLALTLATHPDIVIADEPTSSLDAALSDHTMQALREHADTGAAVLLITHDLRAAASPRVDHVAVMYASRIMESGPAPDVLTDPWHDYTRDLLSALPENGLTPIPGSPPSLVGLPNECVYHWRRPDSRCSGGPTRIREVGNRSVRVKVTA